MNKKKKRPAPELNSLAEIGLRLQSRRLSLGIKELQEVAKEIEVSNSTYGRWEKGESEAGCLQLARAACYLEYTPNDLLLKQRAKGLDEPDLVLLTSLFHDLAKLNELCEAGKPGGESAVRIVGSFVAWMRKGFEADAENGLPPGTTIAYDPDAKATTYAPPPGSRAGEGAALYGQVWPRFREAAQGKGLRVPYFTSVAAGAARVPEEAGELWISGLPQGLSVVCVKVAGESMAPGIKPGAKVLVRREANGFTLPAKRPSDEPTPVQKLSAIVPNDTVWIVGLDDEGATLKRVRYTSKARQDWTLDLVADNEGTEGFPRTIRRGESVTFYGRAFGLVG